MMKSLMMLALVLVSGSAFAEERIDPGSDYFTASSLAYNVDGLEIWNIPRDQQAASIEWFKAKCSGEIPARFTTRIQSLGLDPNLFNYTTAWSTQRVSGYGTLYLCRASVRIKSQPPVQSPGQTPVNPQVAFQFSYSPIVRSDAYATCKQMTVDLDAQATSISLFDRRVYFASNGSPETDPTAECQVLSITIKP